MRKPELANGTIEQLLDLYTQLSIEQSHATFVYDAAKFNRIGDTLYEISNNIKSRPDDRGQSMPKLFGHANSQVRFNSASSVSGLFPHEARQVMQAIADDKWDVLAIDAKIYLRTLDEWLEKQKLT